MNVGTHAPVAQRPPAVLVQTLPFALMVSSEQFPVPGSQVPGSKHSSAGQTLRFSPVQTPDWQVSVWVQRFPSLQASPSVFLGLEHTPPLHVPATWHWSLAVQTIGLVPV